MKTKNKFLRNLCLVALLLPFLSAFSIQQAKALPPTNGAATSKTHWILDKTVNNVDFYYQISKCNDDVVVFLKFDNRNRFNVKITWKEMFTTQGGEQSRYWGAKDLVLRPGVLAQTDCATVVNSKCLILPADVHPAYYAKIAAFEFKDVTAKQSR